MAEQVKVTSLDALESFRASMIIFVTKARQSLDQATDEVRRTRQWLTNEQRVHWESQLRKRRQLLDQAQGELMSARMSEFIDSPSVQQAAVRKAKLLVDEAEEKLRNVKQWDRVFDGRFEPYTKKLDALRQFLDQDFPKGITYLVQVQRTLEAYAESSLPYSQPTASVAVETTSPPPPEPS